MTSPAEKKFEFEESADTPVDVARVRGILAANNGARIRTWMGFAQDADYVRKAALSTSAMIAILA